MIGGGGDHLLGGGQHLTVVGDIGHPDGRGVEHLGTASFEGGDQILGPPVGGHTDPETAQLVGGEPGR